MKIALFLVGLLAASSLLPSITQAAPSPGRKLPGPSAVEAARLKKSPPPNYLAHYLPDDRYKIAGGVWKYVSTDLDTYYHIPSSPNMLRQPASRVIGFANARDAEEAGYVADPTDGTSDATAPGGRTYGFSKQEERYMDQVLPVLEADVKSEESSLVKFREVYAQAQAQGQQGNAASFLTPIKPVAAEYLALKRTLFARINRIKPPRRFQKYHSLLQAQMKARLQFASLVYQSSVTGDISQFAQALEFAKQGISYTRQTIEESDRLRHSPP